MTKTAYSWCKRAGTKAATHDLAITQSRTQPTSMKLSMSTASPNWTMCRPEPPKPTSALFPSLMQMWISTVHWTRTVIFLTKCPRWSRLPSSDFRSEGSSKVASALQTSSIRTSWYSKRYNDDFQQKAIQLSKKTSYQRSRRHLNKKESRSQKKECQHHWYDGE